jgi:hypothetical protein
MGDLVKVDPSVFVKPLVGALDRNLAVTTQALEDMSGAMTEQEHQLSATARNQNYADGSGSGAMQKDQEQTMVALQGPSDKRKTWADLVNPVVLFKNLLT